MIDALNEILFWLALNRPYVVLFGLTACVLIYIVAPLIENEIAARKRWNKIAEAVDRRQR